VCELARLQSSNPSQNRIAGGGEWPGSMFHETSPPYRISITSDDLLFFFLLLFLFHLLFFSLLLFGPSTSAPPLLFIPPLSSGVSFAFSVVCLLHCSPFFSFSYTALPLPHWGVV